MNVATSMNFQFSSWRHVVDTAVNVVLFQGFDQLVNVVLEDSHERVYSESQGVEQIPLGLYIIRGDNM